MKTFKVTYSLLSQNGGKTIKETILHLDEWDDVEVISRLYWIRDWEGDITDLIVEDKQEIC